MKCAVAYIIDGNEGIVWWLPISELKFVEASAAKLRESGVKAWVIKRRWGLPETGI